MLLTENPNETKYVPSNVMLKNKTLTKRANRTNHKTDRISPSSPLFDTEKVDRPQLKYQDNNYSALDLNESIPDFRTRNHSDDRHLDITLRLYAAGNQRREHLKAIETSVIA